MEHKRGLDLDELEVSGSNLGMAEREMNVRFCFATRSERALWSRGDPQ